MSKELSNLITHLSNLHKQKIKQATFDVEFLLGVLGQPIPSAPKQQTTQQTAIDVDGGPFKD